MEDYKKKYEQALGRARTFSQRWQGIEATGSELALQELKEIFPELEESKEGGIRKSIIGFLKTMSSLKDGKTVSNEDFDSVALLEWAAWLESQVDQKPIISDDAIREGIAHFGITQYQITNWLKKYIDVKKQDEQKSADKVEPKFKVGDWVVCCNYEPEQIIGIRNNMYEMSNGDIRPFYMIDSNDNIRLWTIRDAKDGDVLCIHSFESDFDCVFLYQNTHEIEPKRNVAVAHCCIDVHVNKIEFGIQGPDCIDVRNVTPATKEQRDLLFQKMKEAGYEWDAEKKELKEIEQKPEIKGDVLSRFAFYQYDDDVIYLSSLFVRESDRGRGYGSKVLKAAEGVAKTFGVSKIRLKVERNTWMEEWYKKNGYEYLSPDGEYDWLEKRVEQKPADKVEPKFKVGNKIKLAKGPKYPVREIIAIKNDAYYFDKWVHLPFSHQDEWELVEQGGKGTTDKVELKFKSGNWYLCVKDFFGKGVRFDKGNAYYCKLDGCLQEFDSGAHIDIVEELYEYFRPWTIKDAKNGDVLANKDGAIFINAGSDESRVTLDSYCYVSVQGEFCIEEHKTGSWFYKDVVKPATKGQQNLLFQKMKEAGYQWDAEKKELKKIGSKPAWGEEDEKILNLIIQDYEAASKSFCGYQGKLDWLKSLKERLHPKREWSEEDEGCYNSIIEHLKYSITNGKPETYRSGRLTDWLSSLKEKIKEG